MKSFLLTLLLTLLLGGLSAAQDTPLLTYGEPVTGRIDGRNPRIEYPFDGLRGEFVRVTLNITSGDLDAMLVLVDPAGNTLRVLDESDNPRALELQQRLPANGIYRLVVMRFGAALGITSGAYTLGIDRLGVSAESGSALRFGDTVASRITDESAEVFYSFRARRGDLINLTMRRDSGTLDPLLRIVDANRRILVEVDDSDSKNARIERWLVPDDAQYLIVATRYSGEGAFLLTLERIPESALGATPEAAVRLFFDRPDEREIGTERWRQWYVFEGNVDNIVNVDLLRISGSLDPYLILLDSGLNELATNDDIVDGVQRDSRIDGFRLPADGLYYIVATRFEREAGTTIGRYRLTLRQAGSAFDGVAAEVVRIGFNQSVGGALDEFLIERSYAFYGEAGQIMTAVVSRTDGDLSPTLKLLDAEGNTVLEAEAGSANAVLPRFELPSAGVYTLVVSRSSGRGGFILALAERR